MINAFISRKILDNNRTEGQRASLHINVYTVYYACIVSDVIASLCFDHIQVAPSSSSLMNQFILRRLSLRKIVNLPSGAVMISASNMVNIGQ